MEGRGAEHEKQFLGIIASYHPRSSNRSFCSRESQLMPTMGTPRSSLTSARTLGSLKWVTAWTMARARLAWIAAFEDSGTDKDTIAAQLHHHGSISAGWQHHQQQAYHGETAELSSLLEKFIWGAQFLGVIEKFLGAHDTGAANLTLDGADVADGLDDIASTSLALGTDHGSTFGNAAKGLTKVAGTAYIGNLRIVLVYMVNFISRSEDFTLIKVIDANGLQHLS